CLRGLEHSCVHKINVGRFGFLLTDRLFRAIIPLDHFFLETPMNDETRDLILSVFEASLDAQLRAVRRLRRGPQPSLQPRPRKRMSQVDMAFDILKKARVPLHVSDIISRIQSQFGVSVDRESLVSSLTKKVARNDRFSRTEKNTF